MPWKCSFLISILLLSGLLWLPQAGFAASPEQEKVAKTYLQANTVKDLPTIHANIPQKNENLFGEYPFKGFPELGKPRVEENQALLEFTCPVTDSCLPAKGGILFKKENDVWLVRQVLFYNKVPELLLNLPRQSATAADKKHEPAVKELGTAFLKDWQRNSVSSMRAKWFDWTTGKDSPIKGLTMSKLSLTPSTMTSGDTFMKYSMKLSYRWGILSYSMTFKGGLVMVQEDGAWKVRPTMMIFNF